MKTFYLGLFSLIFCPLFSFAQWTGTTDIYNTNPGKVGIGTSNPQTILHIYQGIPDVPGLIIQGNTINVDGALHFTALTFDGDYGNGTGNYSQIRSYSNLYSNWGSQLAFFTTQAGVANTLIERMRINANGYVGIGTTNPAYALDVINNLRVGAQGGSDYAVIYGGAGYGSKLSLFFADGTENVRLAGNNDGWINANHGFLGIGTTSPQTTLDVLRSGVNGGGLAAPVAFRTDAKTINDGIGIPLQALNSSSAIKTYSNVYSLITDPTAGAEGASLNFSSVVNGSAFVHMTMVGGNVGIGTTTPGALLDVNGNLAVAENASVGSISVAQDPGSDSSPSLSIMSLTNRGVGGSSYAWKMYTAAIGGGFGVRPNAFEIWEYPPSASNPDCCLRRFSIDKANGDAQPFFIDKNGGLALGGFSDAGNAFLAVNGNVGIGTNNPSARLQVSGQDGQAIAYFHNNSGTVGNVSGVHIEAGTNSGDYSLNVASSVGTSRLYIRGDGNIGIGTTDPKSYKLAVAGDAVAQSMTVKLQANWPDVVFKKDYALMPLSEVKTYIDKNQHLPEIPAAAEVEKDGVNLGEMNRLLVKKVEELTLYLIEKDREKVEQDKINQAQQQQIDELKKQVEAMLLASRKIQ